MREHFFKARDWLSARADSAQARLWLAIFSFTESCVFIVPPDPLLAALVFVRKERWIYYAALTTITSVMGAIFGYVIGAVLFDTLGAYVVSLYGLGEEMAYAQTFINEGLFLFILTLAFTPIPFKVGVLTAGFVQAHFFVFLFAALLGRGARYFLIAFVAKLFGDHAAAIMNRIWLWSTVVGVVLLSAYVAYLLLWA